jgi:hypothetical protein
MDYFVFVSNLLLPILQLLIIQKYMNIFLGPGNQKYAGCIGWVVYYVFLVAISTGMHFPSILLLAGNILLVFIISTITRRKSLKSRVIFGVGEVIEFLSDTDFPVVVSFGRALPVYYTADGKCQSYAMQTLFPHPVEITKKITKPSINWEHVHCRYNYLAEDSCGAVFLYKDEPFIALNSWGIQGGEAMVAHMFASYVKGTCDWKDSLVKRPD